MEDIRIEDKDGNVLLRGGEKSLVVDENGELGTRITFKLTIDDMLPAHLTVDEKETIKNELRGKITSSFGGMAKP